MIDGVVDIKLIEESQHTYIGNVGFVDVWRTCEC